MQEIEQAIRKMLDKEVERALEYVKDESASEEIVEAAVEVFRVWFEEEADLDAYAYSIAAKVQKEVMQHIAQDLIRLSIRAKRKEEER